MSSYQQSSKAHLSKGIIRCAPKDLIRNETKITSLSATHESFVKSLSGSIYCNHGIAKHISDFIKTNIPNPHQKLFELEMKSITSGTPMAQFIVDTYHQCLIRHNWTTYDFMAKSELLSQIPQQTSYLIRSYLSEYLKCIAMPVHNKQMEATNDGNEEYDEKDDEKDEIKAIDEKTYIKHDMQRILRYISQFSNINISGFSATTTRSTPPRQIDMMFIPKAAADCGINGDFFRSKGIEYKQIDAQKLYRGQRGAADAFQDVFKEKHFSRWCLLIIGGDDTSVGAEDMYLFKPVNSNKLAMDMLNYTELPWIYNTCRNNPRWLKNALTKYNGITVSYHVHYKDVERVYLSSESETSGLTNIPCAIRVFQHNIVDVLRAFCHEIDAAHINAFNCSKIKNGFTDIVYTEFVDKYFADLKLVNYNADNVDGIDNKADDFKKNNIGKTPKYDKTYIIPRKLTADLPAMIIEPIERIGQSKEVFLFMMDKLRLLAGQNGIYELPNGDRIVNFGFHQKTTRKVLYGYAKRVTLTGNENNYQWQFDDTLYAYDEIPNMKMEGVDAQHLPPRPAANYSYKQNDAPQIAEKEMKALLNDKKVKWAKTTVHGITNKAANKRKLTLAFTQKQFKENVAKHNNLNDIDLIPILVFDDKQNWFEYVWIIRIEEGVDIGISFKFESKKLKVNGIYLDKQMLIKHHLLASQHELNGECHCFDTKFVSEAQSLHVTCFEIGNVAAKSNKIKDLQQRNADLKQQIKLLKLTALTSHDFASQSQPTQTLNVDTNSKPFDPDTDDYEDEPLPLPLDIPKLQPFSSLKTISRSISAQTPLTPITPITPFTGNPYGLQSTAIAYSLSLPPAAAQSNVIAATPQYHASISGNDISYQQSVYHYGFNRLVPAPNIIAVPMVTMQVPLCWPHALSQTNMYNMAPINTPSPYYNLPPNVNKSS